MNKAVDQQFRQRDALLKKNGYADYSSYLVSEEWAAVKNWVKTRKGIRWRRCWVCRKTTNLHIHHKTYSIIGTGIKKLCSNMIVVLCKECHFAIHESTRNNQTALRNAVKKFKRDFLKKTNVPKTTDGGGC